MTRPFSVPTPGAEPAGVPLVVLIEDQEDLRQVLASALEIAGMRVEEFGTGTAALEATARLEPDVVVTDLVMPGVDGLEVARRLTREDGTREVPLILVSAHVDPDNRAALTARFDAVLAKPVDPFELVDVVRSLL